jgi:hypothetical protein
VSRLHGINDMIINKFGEDGRMEIGREDRSAQRKTAPVLISSPQIPHNLTWDRVLATELRSKRPRDRNTQNYDLIINLNETGKYRSNT